MNKFERSTLFVPSSRASVLLLVVKTVQWSVGFVGFRVFWGGFLMTSSMLFWIFIFVKIIFCSLNPVTTMQQALWVTMLYYLLDNVELRHWKIFNFSSSEPDSSFKSNLKCQCAHFYDVFWVHNNCLHYQKELLGLIHLCNLVIYILAIYNLRTYFKLQKNHICSL